MKDNTKHIGLTDAQLATSKDGVDHDLLQQGHAQMEEDKKVPLLQSLRAHYPAALWSIFLSTALIMEGYDLNIVSRVCV
jgi:hypothetical protein